MFQSEKALVLDYFQAMEQASPISIRQTLTQFVKPDYVWRGVYPFRKIHGADQVAKQFWQPLRQAFAKMQRRQDIFIAGNNKYDDSVWVMSMGVFLGLFDADLLGIPHTRKIATLRYAEFSCVQDNKITQSGLFVDLIGLMQQAGVNPLPPSTGVYFNYPGPRNHDGLLFADAPAGQGEHTLKILDAMIDDLTTLNESGAMDCPPQILQRSWADDMLWYGPAGIGASYTIARYQEQHQLPFRQNLGEKTFKGHECRFAEGNFACFFGWPNLSNSPLGGWLGLPGGSRNIDMQVVDVYRREGDKLVENWVLLDIPYWLAQQGLDVFARNQQIFRRSDS